MSVRRVWLRGACSFGLPLALAACPSPDIKPVLSPQSLAAALGAAWTMVPLPNTKLTPGAIVQLNPLDAPTLAAATSVDIVWLGTLADCKVPDATLAITAGALPGIDAGSTYSISADVGAKLAQVSLDAGAQASGKADLKIETASDTSLNYISFSAWVADPANAKIFNLACGPILARPNVFVVQEAFIISKGEYSFSSSTGGKIAVTPPPNVPVTGTINGSGGPTGDLTIAQPIVFALKTMQELPQGGFMVASAPIARHRTAHHGAPAPAPVAAASPAPPSPLAGKTVKAIELLPGATK